MSDRPLECGECKRPAKVVYKEIVDDEISCYNMCEQCPVLERKLHGLSEAAETGEPGVCCNSCHTTLESVQRGGKLGCTECYAIFSDVIVSEMQSAEKGMGFKPLFSKRGGAVHIGKSPTKTVDVALSGRIASLNEALNEALKKENYEQAAWIRDQIKELIEKPQDDSNETTK